jgi:CG-1 domain
MVVKSAMLMLAEFSLEIILCPIASAFSKCIYIAGGSLYIFNKRINRYFRNDGYSWQRKKNGKTLAEGHERLKVFLSFFYLFTYFSYIPPVFTFNNHRSLLFASMSSIVLV